MSALHALPDPSAVTPAAETATPISTADLLHRQDIWRARDGGPRTVPAQATGHPQLDAQLPGGGWPLGRLSEILLPQIGMGEIELLLPLLARRTQAGQLLVYVRPPCPPCIPALARAGIALDRLLLIAAASEREALWATEQILACGVPSSGDAV